MSPRLRLGALAAAAALLALGPAMRPARGGRPPVHGAAAVVERFQCYRCHDAPGKLVPAVEAEHCVRCHQAVLRGDHDARYRPEALARWKRDIVHLDLVPSLVGVERLERRWLVEFLKRPHDLRPGLAAAMPRMPIAADDAEAIADHFLGSPAPALEPEPTLGAVSRGREVYRGAGCGACHRFGGTDLAPPAPSADPALRLAPDLRHARSRMRASTLLAWLRDPQALKADARMPRPALPEPALRDLAAFILEAPLAPEPAGAPAARLPLLSRRVSYAEVSQRVFRKVCWHCHSDPAPNGGDGGPGNTGGFGYAGVGLDLGSHAAILRGGRDAQGRRVDVLAPDASGAPRLVSVMLARHAEVAGRGASAPGMPLGLSPIPLEDIQRVDSWIAQGCPSE